MPDDMKAAVRRLEQLVTDWCEASYWTSGGTPASDRLEIDHGKRQIATDLRALLSERRKMVEALTRQADNVAFILNRVELPPAWLEKFDRELAEDRAALTGSREHG